MTIAPLALLTLAGGVFASEPAGKTDWEFVTHRFADASVDLPAGWEPGPRKTFFAPVGGTRGLAKRDFYMGAPWYHARAESGRWASVTIQRTAFGASIPGFDGCAHREIRSVEDYIDEMDAARPQPDSCPGLEQGLDRASRSPVLSGGFRLGQHLKLPMGTGLFFIHNVHNRIWRVSADKEWLKTLVWYVAVYEIPGEKAVYTVEMITRREDRDFFAPVMARALTSFRLEGRPFEKMDDDDLEGLQREMPLDSEEVRRTLIAEREDRYYEEKD
jgi:hypothetical protein